MKYIQPDATLVSLMGEDVIAASFVKVEIQEGDYNMGQKDEIDFEDLLTGGN